MKVTCRLMSALSAARTANLEFPGNDVAVRAVLNALVARHPEVRGQVVEENGELHRGVKVFVGSEDVKQLEGSIP